MWESFNETIISRELQWAQDIGFSFLRVFLHLGPYKLHASKFLNTLERFLLLAKKNKHRVIFVLFDDCWNSEYFLDRDQPAPIPGVHNSQWVQCPGDVPV